MPESELRSRARDCICSQPLRIPDNNSIRSETNARLDPQRNIRRREPRVRALAEYPVYSNGESQRFVQAVSSRKRWRLAKRLTPAQLAALRAFYEARNGPAEPFTPNGCLAHAMKRRFGAVLVEPQGTAQLLRSAASSCSG